MSGSRFAARRICRWLLIFSWTSGLTAQTCLVLSTATINSDGTASLDLSLYSLHRTPPAAVQWTFQYSSASISSLTVDDGPTLTSAGKTAICAGHSAAYNCLAVGLNENTIANGVVAKVIAALAPGSTTATIEITNPLGASAAGNAIPIFSRVLSIPGAQVSSDCRLRPPLGNSVGGKSSPGH